MKLISVLVTAILASQLAACDALQEDQSRTEVGAAIAKIRIIFLGTVRKYDKTAYELFPDSQVAALADAAAKGKTKEVERLVKAGVPVDGLGQKNLTPLTFALLTHNGKGMEALLKLGANPNHRIEDKVYVGGLPIVLFLPTVHSPELLDLMLKYGVDPNTRQPVKTDRALTAPYEGDSLLIRSVMNLDNVKVLLKHGADVNIKPHIESASSGAATAASSAAGLGQLDVVELLIEHGANDYDHIAHKLQVRSWATEVQPQRIRILRMLKARGARIYRGYKPTQSPDISMYSNQDMPEDLISPGHYIAKESTEDKPVDISKYYRNTGMAKNIKL